LGQIDRMPAELMKEAVVAAAPENPAVPRQRMLPGFKGPRVMQG
jgi:hypothetical protein